MTVPKPNTPLKIGLLTVAASYFLFTLHALFTLQWIGEWNALEGFIRTVIFTEDVFSTVTLIFRFLGSIIALILAVNYVKGKKASLVKLLRVVLVFEAIYWLGFFVTAVFSTVFVVSLLSTGGNSLYLSVLTAVPAIFESTILPAVLLVLAYKLSPSKPVRGMVKWGLIVGAMYLFVFWLLNSSMWLTTVNVVGTQYLTAYPINLVNFIVTLAGLLALTVYMVLFYRTTLKTGTLKIRPLCAILCLLGLYFVWNYLSWMLFGGDYLWNAYWPAWFLGHNLDLWMMSLPLLGLPLLFGETEKVTV